MKLNIKALLIITFLALFFIFGTYWAERKAPYYQLKTALNKIIVNKNKDYLITKAFDNSQLPVKKIDSVHLPLILSEYNLNGVINDKTKGAICSIDDIVIGVSWKGSFYSIDTKNNLVNNINITPPNNNQLKTAQITSDNRVYDIECKKNKNNNNIDLFISYDKVHKGKKYLILDMAVLDNNLLIIKEWNNLFISDPWQELDQNNGAGRIKILESGKILLSISHISDNPMSAQDSSTTHGKTVEVNPGTKEFSIFSSGHRNMQGIEQVESGAIYTTEHGPKGGDELNFLQENGNYGWPLYTHGGEYEAYGWRGNKLVGRHPYDDSFTGPLMSWVPSIATSNLIEVRDFHDRWNGDLLIGTLKNRSLYRIRIKNRHVVFSERIWIGDRIRDITRLIGKIALLTDSNKLLIISLDEKTLERNTRVHIDIRQDVLAKCTVCHHFGATNATSMAPSLSGLFDRSIGGDTGYERYSPALTSMQKKMWDIDSLKLFLKNPDKFSPGVYMPKVNLNPREIDQLIGLLSQNEIIE